MPIQTSLTPRQLAVLAGWLPGYAVRRDLSWGLVDTTVWEIECGGERFVVKAAGPDDHHLAREVQAHREWIGPWVTAGRAPELVHADAEVKIIVTRYLDGDLVLGHDAARDPEAYRQAGELLAQLHSGGTGAIDADVEQRANEHTLAWLAKPHRIEPRLAERLGRVISRWPTPPVPLVPTHGDYQPRNWLIHDGQVRVIDFGRAALRPAMTDFVRMAGREFHGEPAQEAAFLAGYGSDPREPEAWLRWRVREAVGTAVWAYQVGDTEFEAHGIRLLAELESQLGTD